MLFVALAWELISIQSMITTNTLKFINSVVIAVRAYTHKGKIVAKSHTPRFEHQGDYLRRWRATMVKQYGEAQAQRMVSQLKVTKSMRQYHNLNRIMPRTSFIDQGKRLVLTGPLAKGLYYRAAKGRQRCSR